MAGWFGDNAPDGLRDTGEYRGRSAVPPPNVPSLGLQGQQSQIQEWYQKRLGRTGSQDEINTHMQNPGGLSAVDDLLAKSPEAAAYATQLAAPRFDPTFTTGADAGNGYNRVTYAGFSPQDHQGADLNDPMKAKYALMQYMVHNGALTGGPQGNAAAIAAAMNKQYGTAYGNQKFFTAQDAETILMPDGQYVHAAPNGYGMARGTYNPDNTGEVFWGATKATPGASGGASSGTNGASLASLLRMSSDGTSPGAMDASKLLIKNPYQPSLGSALGVR